MPSELMSPPAAPAPPARAPEILVHGEKPPIGAPPGAAPVLKSAAGSVVYSLHPGERRPFRLYGTAALLIAATGVIILKIGQNQLIGYAKSIKESNPGLSVLLLLGGLMGIVVLSVVLIWMSVSSGPVGFRLSSKAIRKRPCRLFASDKRTRFAGAEPTATFKKQKFLPDDFALLHPTPGLLQIEAGSFRAHIRAEDLQIQLYEVSKRSCGLAISANFDGVPWSITVALPMQGNLWYFHTKAKDRSLKLWKDLYAGINPAGY